jgi:exosortase/archaeosortase family protein
LPVFVVVTVALLVAYLYPYPDASLPKRLMLAYLSAYASVAGGILSLLDSTVRVDGLLITGRYPMRIVQSCDAAEALILYLALVLAYPASPARRLVGGALGLATVLAANLLRITSLYLIGVARPDLFEVAHAHVWPLVLLAVAALSFMTWTSWARNATDGSGRAVGA